MAMRTCAQFTSGFPDDSVEEGGDIVQFGGKNVADALVAILRARSFQVSDPGYLGLNGWDFNVTEGKTRVSVQVSDVPPIFILITDLHLPFNFFKGDFGRRELHAEVLAAMHAGMKADERFADLSWRHQEEIEVDGAGAPAPY